MEIKVFIADDHTVVRDGLRALLEANPGLKVVGGSASGRQAIGQVQKLQPDVVIMDISMPEVSGVNAAQQILEDCPQTKVIILSIFGDPEHIYWALRAGAQGYLLKDSSGREVIEAIFKVQGGDYYLSQPVVRTMITDYLEQRGILESKDPLQDLSQREREIFHWVIKGKTSAEIAKILFISPKTVESYRSRMMRKLGLSDLPSLIRFAIQKGLES